MGRSVENSRIEYLKFGVKKSASSFSLLQRSNAVSDMCLPSRNARRCSTSVLINGEGITCAFPLQLSRFFGRQPPCSDGINDLVALHSFSRCMGSCLKFEKLINVGGQRAAGRQVMSWNE